MVRYRQSRRRYATRGGGELTCCRILPLFVVLIDGMFPNVKGTDHQLLRYSKRYLIPYDRRSSKLRQCTKVVTDTPATCYLSHREQSFHLSGCFS